MPCFKPLEAWRDSELTANGLKKIVFKSNGTVPIQLPCGQCIGCRLEHSLLWAIRCIHEAQIHEEENSFITLTYNPEKLPSDGSLIPWHVTDFLKRLRKSIAPKKIKYFMCGEYGEKFTRPHYHICLFGHDFQDKEIYQEREGIILWTSDTLEKLWGHGFTTTGELNFNTAAYTARYILKKPIGQNREQHYYRTCEHTMTPVQIEPEYIRMSNGIGKAWLAKYSKDIWPSDYLIHKNKKFKVPRYYDKQLLPEALDYFKIQRREAAKLHRENNTPQRLAVREEIQQLKAKQLKRGYEAL